MRGTLKEENRRKPRGRFVEIPSLLSITERYILQTYSRRCKLVILGCPLSLLSSKFAALCQGYRVSFQPL